MKYIYILCVFLCGCSLIRVINTPTFNVDEYSMLNKMRTETQFMTCSKEEVSTLYKDSVTLKNFSEYLPFNTQVTLMEKNLNIIVEELYNHQNYSDSYCRFKLNIIQEAISNIQRVVGEESK